MISGQDMTMLVGAQRRDLVWNPQLATHWATVARHALSVVSVTPTSTPIIWVDTAQQPLLGEVVRLAQETSNWEATCRWLALLTADLRLAETFLCLEMRRPLVYPFVIHFHLVLHSAILVYIARGGAFHLGMEAAGQVIPFFSVSTSGLAEQITIAGEFADGISQSLPVPRAEQHL